MMNKKLVLGCMIIICLVLSMTTVVVGFSDPSNMTDEQFFGVWDSSTSTWITEGKINYNYNSSLAPVENAVKAGDYTIAKTELLNYYKNRTSRTVVPYATSMRDTNVANLVSDDIFTSYNELYVNTVTVNNTYQTVSVDVTSAITSAMDESKQCNFTLMARKKETSAAEFYSRENADTTNRPRLEVIVNGQLQTLYPIKDSYIRPGIYEDTNYGTYTMLDVKDWGVPFDEYTRRAYIQFDLSGLAATPTASTLKLYGINVSGTGNKDIMVFKTYDTTWVETALTWNTSLGNTFSWQSASDSTDWNQPSSGADSDWMYIITRFGFAAQLAYEYNQTSNETYANNLLRLMLDFINDQTAIYPRSLDTASRASAWVRAYHYIRNSTFLDSAANTAILKELWQVADWLYDPSAYHPSINWGIIETDGLYAIAVYFPEFINSPSWQSIANSRADYLITNLNYGDGSYTEASTFYARSAAWSFYAIYKMGVLNGQAFSSTYENGLKAMGSYIMNTSFPNGYDPLFGDSDYEDYKSFVLDIGSIFDDSNLVYFGSDGTSGTPPSYTSVNYPVHKTEIMRTGWQDNDLYMHINNNTGNHEHPDQCSIIAYGYGRPLIVDPGRGSYTNATVPNWLRKTTEAHNTIEINDTKQDTSKPDLVNSWVTNGYYDFYEGSTESTSGFEHCRSVLFIKPSFWIVSDYVKAGSGINKYEQNWHMLPTANLVLDSTTKKVKTNFEDDNGNIQVIPADPDNLTASLEEGYYSNKIMNITSAKYASYVKNAAGDVTFDTVLYPTAAEDNRDVRVTRLTTTPNVAATTATALRVDLNYGSNGNIGYYYLSHESVPIISRIFDEYSFNGKMAYVEKDSDNNLIVSAIKSGMTLKRNATTLINSNVTIKEMAVKWNGATLEISGSSGLINCTDTNCAIAIYAPEATSVKLNGIVIPYTKNGDYIYAIRQLDDTPYLLNENFDGMTTGSQPPEWTVTTDVNTTCTVEEVPNALDKTIKLYDNNSAGFAMVTKAFIPQVDTITAEWKFKEETTAGNWPIFALMSGSTRATDINTASGPVLAYTDNLGVQHTIQSIDPDTWYTVRIEVNIVLNTYDIYVNNILKVTGAPFRNAVTSIDGIWFANGYGPTGTVYINDVKVIGMALINDNFNCESTGSQPSGWTVTASANTNCTITEIPSTMDKSMRLYDNKTAGYVIATKTFIPQVNVVTAEWKFKEETTAGNWPIFALMSGSTRATDMNTASGPILAYTDNSGVQHTIQSISPDTWYTIKVVANVAANTYDIYINGVLKVTGAPFRNAVTSIDGIWFSTGYGPTGTVDIDNVRVGGWTLASDNFNNGTTGNQPSGWTITTSANTSCTIAEVPSATDKSNKLYDNSTNGFAMSTKLFELQDLHVTAEWKFKEETTAGNWPIFALMSGSTRATDMNTASGPILAYTDNSGVQHTIQSISPDTWYTIKVVANVATNTYDIYVNGTLIVTGAPFRNTVTYIDRILFCNGFGPTGTVYINDVNISK